MYAWILDKDHEEKIKDESFFKHLELLDKTQIEMNF